MKAVMLLLFALISPSMATFLDPTTQNQIAAGCCPPGAMCQFCPPPMPTEPFPSYPSFPTLPFCPTCYAQTPPFLPTYPQPYWTQPWFPMNNHWRNFWGPPMYNGWGTMPGYLPYDPRFTTPNFPQNPGGVTLMKPVVYVTAPDRTKISIQMKLLKPSTLISAVPEVSSKGWRAEVHGNQLKTSEGTYEYFFYDARVKEHLFQDKSGLCGDRKEVLDFMVRGLEWRGFPKNSVLEFKSTWAVKLPHNQDLCAYPQTEKELGKAIQFEIEPKNAELLQVQYVIVPSKYHDAKKGAAHTQFSAPPQEEFKLERWSRAPASEKNKVRVFDWGVGFLVVDRPNPK